MSPSGAVRAALKPLKKLVIAVHGIGNQRRGETIRSVAYWFGDRSKTRLPLVPLGFFNTPSGELRISRLDTLHHEFDDVGFAEVYWADIPREAVADQSTLEETKAWGKSVAGRAELAHEKLLAAQQKRRAAGQPTPRGQALGKIDFHRCSAVIEEVVESIAVLENLLSVFDKMGFFRFELGTVLRDYLDDVQTVTEFAAARARIVDRFDGGVTKLFEAFQDTDPPELYIVAHSEGTVVAFLALLGAISKRNQGADGATKRHWIEHVRGFMTIGSPIDKHLILWPHLFEGLELGCSVDASGVVKGSGLHLPQPIAWNNYYDVGDPIGFDLDTAIRCLKDWNCAAFDFKSKDNYGFSRSYVPGKAHNDYWTDPEVFGHFIGEVVRSGGKRASALPVQPPRTQWRKALVSKAFPFGCSLLLHLAAVFMLFKGITALITPNAQTQELIAAPHQLALLGLLLFCTTWAARVPRLVNKRKHWDAPLLAVAGFCAAAATCILGWPGLSSLASLAAPLDTLWNALRHPFPGGHAGPGAYVLAATAAALSGFIVWTKENWGRRILLVLGAVLVAVLVGERVAGALGGDQPAWPLLLASAAFLYLWWLGMIFFDLTFIWHRYIRSSRALQALRPLTSTEQTSAGPKSDRAPDRMPPLADPA